jgi:RHS repeat-associated protein
MAMSVVYSNFCGMVVSETRGGVESDYVSDPLGSTVGLMNSVGTMTDRWEYWPYGEVISHTGSSTTPLTFLGVLGYFKDILDKFFYVRARHLRVDLARWLTVDPLWPIEPPYSYVRNSPVNSIDPTGLWRAPLPGTWHCTSVGGFLGHDLWSFVIQAFVVTCPEDEGNLISLTGAVFAIESAILTVLMFLFVGTAVAIAAPWIMAILGLVAGLLAFGLLWCCQFGCQNDKSCGYWVEYHYTPSISLGYGGCMC